MRRILLILAIFIVGCSSGHDTTPAGLVYDGIHLKFEPSTVVLVADEEPTKEYVLYIHNKERASKGLDQLEFDAKLNQKSQEHAEWMTKHGMIHSRGGGVEGFNSWGENIAMGYDTEEKVMEGWMHSSGHKRNILTKSFTHAGIGIARTSSGTLYWCVQFGGK